MRSLYGYIFVLMVSASYAQMNGYIRKASRATAKNKLELARTYYLKAYALDTNYYRANLGLGVVLSEFMDRPKEALPYLEKAYHHSPADTSIDLIFALLKCYQHFGKYDKALEMHQKLNGSTALVDDDLVYQMDLKKRKKDCVYALNKLNTPLTKDYYVINLGSKINTNMPEYVPVITPREELIFTSKRKDLPQEKLNEVDGKYFESMYISKLENGVPQTVSRYTLPDSQRNPKFWKYHESVISISPDGKWLYVYRDNKLYEVPTDSVQTSGPKKLPKMINFGYYQNHAYLSKDAKTLFFTSDAEEGLGGTDIYQSTKEADGNWGKPKNLGKPINTEYDEEAPFLSDDGQTLFFSSTGHPGYGNYDVYKSTLVNGVWSEPENLQAPINSSSHDIFLTQNSSGTEAYFSSSREGGYGDMDIYKVNYIKNFPKTCSDTSSHLLSITSTVIDNTKGLVSLKATMPSYYTSVDCQWVINDSVFDHLPNEFTKPLMHKAGNNVVMVKVLSYCDTCYKPLVACKTATVDLTSVFVAVDPVIDHTGKITSGKNPYDTINKDYVSENKLREMGFNLTPIHFNVNKSKIRPDAEEILASNIAILKQHPEVSILIYGFTDSRASKAYNLELSKKRALQVKRYLISKGIHSKQISQVLGKGEAFLLNKCVDGAVCTEPEHEQNRRVEFILVNDSKK